MKRRSPRSIRRWCSPCNKYRPPSNRSALIASDCGARQVTDEAVIDGANQAWNVADLSSRDGRAVYYR